MCQALCYLLYCSGNVNIIPVLVQFSGLWQMEAFNQIITQTYVIL